MRYCLADFFLLQKKKEITPGLIRENKIAGIACRVAASSNNGMHSDKIKLRRYALQLYFAGEASRT